MDEKAEAWGVKGILACRGQSWGWNPALWHLQSIFFLQTSLLPCLSPLRVLVTYVGGDEGGKDERRQLEGK